MRHNNCLYRLLFVSMLLMLPLFTLAQTEKEISLIPAPTGPYIVGTTSRYFVDETRDEPYTTDPNDKRELIVQFWYPAEVEEGMTPAPYIPHSDVVIPGFNSAFSTVTGIDLSLDVESFANLQSHAFSNVPISNDRPNYPVLIFSHGYIGTPVFWSAQLEEMASHGYIIAAINHTYSSAVTVFPDNRVVGFSADDPPRLLELIAADQIFVATQLYSLEEDDPESMFTGRLNLEQLGIFGQSLGGSAAILSCYLDSRFRACANEDGTVEARIISEGLNQPCMFLLSISHPGLHDRFYARLQGPTYTIAIDGFQHIDFSDIPLWSDIMPLVEASLIGNNDRLRSIQIVNAYLLAFFNKHLKGEEDPLLDGPPSDYPEVNFRSQNM